MNKLATIQRIHSIQPHPNPEVERLEVAKIMEWPVVVPKGQYKERELVVFIEIDSIVPESNPYFEFMRKQKFRIWNARFKGAPSSGLVCPISILPEYRQIKDEWDVECKPWCSYTNVDGTLHIPIVEGLDVSTILGITKYERPIDITVGGDAVGGYPTNLISISDEDNMLSHSSALSELEGKEIYISQKVDGSSTTFIFNNGEFKAYSRRQELKAGSGFPWRAVEKYDIKNKMTSLGRNLAIQAESIGPKLNGNSLGLKELEIRVFRIKDLDKREIVNYYKMLNLCEQLQLPRIDIIDVCQFNKNKHTVEYFRFLADGQLWPNSKKSGEGIVVAPTIPFHSYILDKEWSLKVINQNYKQ